MSREMRLAKGKVRAVPGSGLGRLGKRWLFPWSPGGRGLENKFVRSIFDIILKVGMYFEA